MKALQVCIIPLLKHSYLCSVTREGGNEMNLAECVEVAGECDGNEFTPESVWKKTGKTRKAGKEGKAQSDLYLLRVRAPLT